LTLEKIENNTEVEAKPPSVIKSKGAEGKCRMESMDSCIPKKSSKFNANGTPIKRNGSTGSAHRNGHADKNHSNQREHEGANFAQIVCKEVKKSFRKQLHKG
jgi:hypothetical protein